MATPVHTVEEAYDLLPLTERTMLKHRGQYPFEMLNDLGYACTYRVVWNGNDLGIIVYGGGKKLACHALASGSR